MTWAQSNYHLVHNAIKTLLKRRQSIDGRRLCDGHFAKPLLKERLQLGFLPYEILQSIAPSSCNTSPMAWSSSWSTVKSVLLIAPQISVRGCVFVSPLSCWHFENLFV